ncbi:hypothetical protein B7463_g11382, partial [Scytalidium lignicola]
MALPAAAPATKQGEKLWEKAFNSLDSDVKSSLGQARTHRRNVLVAVLKTAEEKRQICLLKRWKFKKSNGDEIIVRDVVEKIAKWIERFISIGDVAVQFDATSASLPWAVVRFLLQANINDVQLFGAMVNDLEVIARLITRYHEFEIQHLQRSSALKSTLEEALTCLYAEVLIYLGQTVAFFKESTLVRVAKSPFRLADNSQMQKILTRENEVVKLAKLADTETLHFIQAMVIRVSDQATASARIIEEEKYTKMLKWLSMSPYSLHHRSVSDTRTQDFGHWLLQHSEYRDWNNSSSSSILLLHGIVGCGKTNLCSVIVDSLLSTAIENPLAAPFAYFYCSACEFEPERTSPDEILRSILRQLAINRTGGLKVRDFLWSEYERRSAAARVDGMELSKLRAKDCVELILELVEEDPITIVVDALDEVQERDRYVLLEAFNRITAEADNVVKVFLTSRTENKIIAALETSKKINITSNNTHSDMEAFVRQQLDNAVAQRRLLGGNVCSDLRDTLLEILVDGAGEMFLLPKLQIEYLCRMKHEDDILPALKRNTVPGIDQIYEETLSRILQSGVVARDVAIKVFSWMLYMKEPLTPPALLTALTTSTKSSSALQLPELLDLCCNLVLLDTECNVVRFAHNSVQEYLSMQDLFTDTAAHRLLALACLEACSSGPPLTYKPALRCDYFYSYAAKYWPIHFQGSQVKDQRDNAFKQLVSFMFHEDLDFSLSFEDWLENVKKIVEILPNDHAMKPDLDAVQSAVPEPLFLAAVFGLDCLLNLLAMSSAEQDWDQRNHLGHTAIYLAAATGHLSTTSILIDQGAEINVECGQYGSPLYAACFAGHTEVVSLLLKHGASITRGAKFKNALEAAFRGDREDVTLCLVQHDSIINNAEDYEQTVQGAAQAGFLRVVDWLDRPALASPFRKGTPDRVKAKTAKAIRGGQLGVLQRFLNNASDPTALLPHDAIAIAALYGHTDLIPFLLDKGMGIESESMFGSPLRTASLMNRKHVVKLLIERGADVNACGSMGDALHVAAVKGHTQIVQLLIQEGANVNQHAGFYGNALQGAAYHGHKEAVELLLNAKANVHDRGFAIDAFHAAAEGGHQDIVLYMLDRGYKYYDSPPPISCYAATYPSRYRPLMRDASPGRNDHPSRRGSAVRATRPSLPPVIQHISDFDTIFEAAAGTSQPDEVAATREYLTPRYSRWSHCPLEVSASAGHESVVNVLLQQRERLGIPDQEVANAMKAAARNGHLSVVEILLDYIAAQKPIKDFIRSIFNVAYENKQSHIVDFALDLASRRGFTDEVDRMRLESLEGTEKPPIAEVSKEQVVSDFVNSCKIGNIDAISRILQPNHLHLLDPGMVDQGLELSATHGLLTPVRLLLESGKLPRKPMIPDELFISTAANGHVEVMQCLVFHRPDIRTSSTTTGRALIVACKNRHIDTVRYLIQELAADVNALSPDPVARKLSLSGKGRFIPDRRSPLSSPSPSSSSSSGSGLPAHRRSHSWSSSNSMAMLDDRNETNERRSDPELSPMISPLQAALRVFEASNPRDDAYYEWCEDRTNIQDQTKLEDVVMLLLDCGSNPNDLGGRDRYPIQVASAHCPYSVLKQLVEAGADVNVTNEGHSPLEAAAGREESAAPVIRKLLEAGATLPTDKLRRKTLFDKVLAFFMGDTKRKSYFCEEDDPDGRFLMAPSLEYVFRDGPGAALYILLSQFQEEQTHDTRYGLVLQMAAFLNDRDFVRLLLSRGVDVNVTGYYYGTALQAAVRCGHKVVAELLLEAGAEVNIVQGRWHTALRAAVVGGHDDVVRLLINHGADPHLKVGAAEDWTEPKTILQLAVRTGNPSILEALLAAGADVSEVESDTPVPHPLVLSAQQGNAAMVQALLGAGAPVNVSSQGMRWDDANPLHAAVRGGHIDVISMLLDRGADVDKDIDDGGTPLYHAADKANLQAVQLLLAAGANVNHGSHYGAPLQRAARNSHLDIVQLLLAAGAKISGPPHIESALSIACEQKNLPLMEVLLEAVYAGGSPDQIVDEAFVKVIEMPDHKVCELLLDYAPATTKRFFQVCAAGVQPSVKGMLDQGIGVDAEDEETGNRPLHIAALHLQPDIVRILIDCGADVHSRSDKYGTPLMAALEGCVAPWLGTIKSERAKALVARLSPPLRIDTWRGRDYSSSPALDFRHVYCCESIVQFLVEKGVDVNVGCEGFGFPLHLAALAGSETLVKLLLEKEADVNAAGGYSETALFAAIEGNHPDIVSLLLQYGAHTDHLHQDFGSPLHFACTIGNAAIVRKLLEHGAEPSVVNGKGYTPFTIALKLNERCSGERLVDIFLRLGPKLRIVEEDLLVASQLGRNDSTLFTLLELNKDIIISEDIIVGVLQHIYDESRNLRLLMDRNGGIGVTEKMLRTNLGSRVLMVLLEYQPTCKITPEILKAQQNLQSIATLLRHEPNVTVTEAVVVRALEIKNTPMNQLDESMSAKKVSAKKVLEMFWERNPQLNVTPVMLKAAPDAASMEFLLQRLKPGSGVSDDVIAAIRQPQISEKLRLLLRHDPSVQVSMATIESTINRPSNLGTLSTFLEFNPELLITEKIFLQCFSMHQYSHGDHRKDHAELLRKHGKTLKFTKKIRKVINRVYQFQSDLVMKELFYSLRLGDAMEAESTEGNAGDSDGSEMDDSNGSEFITYI